jgi:hypothetical protein
MEGFLPYIFLSIFISIFIFFPPPIIRDYPPNLSISISGGKETNWDSLSNGE